MCHGEDVCGQMSVITEHGTTINSHYILDCWQRNRTCVSFKQELEAGVKVLSCSRHLCHKDFCNGEQLPAALSGTGSTSWWLVWLVVGAVVCL